MKTAKGMLAICGKGELGLILSDGPVEVTYPDHTSALAWTGIHLRAELLGQPWSSRRPRVVPRLTRIFKQMQENASLPEIAAELKLLIRVAGES